MKQGYFGSLNIYNMSFGKECNLGKIFFEKGGGRGGCGWVLQCESYM